MEKAIFAVLCDQDDTLTRVVHSGVTNSYTRAMQSAVVALMSNDHPEYAFATSDAFHAYHESLYYAGRCPPSTHGERFGIDPVVLFETFHDNFDTAGIVHDTASASVLNEIQDRALLLTDAAYNWALRRRHAVGHQLAIQSRSCMAATGLFGATKSASNAPWWFALDRLNEMTGGVAPENVLVVDDSPRVLARAAGLGFQVVQCTWGGVKPHADFKQIGHAGTYLADIFGLPRPDGAPEQLTPAGLFR